MLFISILVILFCNIVSCWILIEMPDPDILAGTTDKCYGKMENVGFINKDQYLDIPNKCMRAYCEPEGHVRYTGCPPVNVEPPCIIIPGNISAPYPDCCFDVLCPDLPLEKAKLDLEVEANNLDK